MRVSSLLKALLSTSFLGQALTTPVEPAPARLDPASKRNPVVRGQDLQDIVTYDGQSYFIYGERMFLFSGSFHPFRLPVTDLWIDVFQKIKALGFNAVTFYVDWALVEAEPGNVRFDGIFDVEPFLQAAAAAGLYLLARPGPYINAEVSAGGIPSWALLIGCRLRGNCTEWEDSTKNYMAAIGSIIAKYQITNGGPIILTQVENEYTSWPGVADFPAELNREYMAFLESELRAAGIVVPLTFNDDAQDGLWAPGTGLGAVDVYGIDSYPLGFDCSDPLSWGAASLPANWQIDQKTWSPTTPFTIFEFQGGSMEGWGDVSQDQCNAMVGPDAVRIFYKNNFSFGIKWFNLYMTYGGTNWGNLGYDGCYTSYDYGAAINEYREVIREKYSAEKLEANFFKVSPGYLTATPGNVTAGVYADTDAVSTTPLFGQQANSNFYVVRQTNWNSTGTVDYKITLAPSGGDVTIPQLGGQLSLIGRDSKMMVTDYPVGKHSLVYSSADIFSWGSSRSGKTALIMYAAEGETNEFSIKPSAGRGKWTGPNPSSSGSSTQMSQMDSETWTIKWSTTEAAQSVSFGSDLVIYLLWRNDAYQYWTLELPAAAPIGAYSHPGKEYVIVKAGYLMRTAQISGTELQLTGDFNATTDVELVFDPTDAVQCITVNGNRLSTTKERGVLKGTVEYNPPSLDFPDFSTLEWKTIDSLPEIHPSYDDSCWTPCDHTTSTNDQLALLTPFSLFANDYGYDTGSFEYRGHFVANGNENYVTLNVSGGTAFANSVWLDQTFLGSYVGSGANSEFMKTYAIPANATSAGKNSVLTVVIDMMGETEEGPGTDTIKGPNGILNFDLAGHSQRDISWRMTGNLGGWANYPDKARGPRNENGMWAIRQGYFQPDPPDTDWAVSNPMDGISGPGVQFYTTEFDLNIPVGWDVPIGVAFSDNSSASSGLYRLDFYINGYQFGKFVPYVGPQFEFPVPEGILNYDGKNTLAISFWALEEGGAKLGGVELKPKAVVLSALPRPGLSPQPKWMLRPDAY
ncbi:beta-galactosidase E [Penicillium cinerascens]|uniref:Beta-galactosidase n=1 Tax=Penicillium cinerascens TaxID=70096 RepID=A0A9W9J8B6_9EURO|nr:beta-galactosidase E [Penicillium cinerascens]KAJ5190140.1 beta-galactosidase E [Penicillium cinerascens]